MKMSRRRLLGRTDKCQAIIRENGLVEKLRDRSSRKAEKKNVFVLEFSRVLFSFTLVNVTPNNDIDVNHDKPCKIA